MKHFCATCDRVNGDKARFCGSCGHSLIDVGSYLEKYSFILWGSVACIFFWVMPATLIYVLLDPTYWAVKADEIFIAQTDTLAMSGLLLLVCLSYVTFYRFMLRHFGHRNFLKIGSMLHILCALVGLGVGVYYSSLSLQFITSELQQLPEQLAQRDAEQLLTVYRYAFGHYISFCLFYFTIIMLTFLTRKKGLSM